jgi:hypothetical protein
MKKIIIVLVTALVFVDVVTFARDKDSNSSIENIEFKVPVPKSDEGILRSPARKVISAFIQENLLTVNFTSSAPNATIAISDALTGEVEYTEVCNAQSATIDLTMLALTGSGSYKIEVSTASWKRVGEFTY